MKDKTYTLYNGVSIPAVGFGTWQTKSGKEAYDAVTWALEAGYRHIDTAYIYGNEESIAKAIQDSHIHREEIFITTKLPADIKTYEGTLEYFQKSLDNLKTDYIDLYLIHAPWPWTNVGLDCTEGNIEVWKAMIELYKQKKVRAIGVSNFHQKNIEPLLAATNFKPMVNQIRYFIGNTQDAITSYCQKNDILIEAYSPLATGEILENEKLKAIAEKYKTTIAKICLRYCYQTNTLPLPKSVHKERIFDNLNFDFEIDQEDMDYLNSLQHIGPTRPLRS
ncbi:MAG: aldo/keto reductase [Anaeroplasmataceae bacterium]|nr:aldo/keto reductase [Anaeroplasmataceae bacterium]